MTKFAIMIASAIAAHPGHGSLPVNTAAHALFDHGNAVLLVLGILFSLAMRAALRSTP